jgi:hypothetical protein
MGRHESDVSSSEDDRRRRHRHRGESHGEGTSSRRRSRRSTSRSGSPRPRHRSPLRGATPFASQPPVPVVSPAVGMAALEGCGRGLSLEKIFCTCRRCKGVVLQSRSQVRSHLGNHGPFRPRTDEVSCITSTPLLFSVNHVSLVEYFDLLYSLAKWVVSTDSEQSR